MKIVYCLNTIRHWGGIQKITIVKANALANIPNNKVFIIVTDNKSGILQEPLSPKVTLIDLDINYFTDDWKGRIYALKNIITKQLIHKKKLKEILNFIQPDFVISTGLSEKFILPLIKGKWKIIRELHSNKNYRNEHAINFYDKIKAFVTNHFDYNYMIKKYDRIILLTNEDKEVNWRKSIDSITVIPNPSTFKINKISNLSHKKVISIGRLCPSKNYSSLIKSFKYVTNRHPDWILEIYGDGEQKSELEKLITELRLNRNIFLRGSTIQIEKELTNASIFAFTSLSEGFGLSIIEAMSCGLPVVSYACPCGPKDIITEGKDGFLVNVNDEITLANKICLLIENNELRKQMSDAAIIKAKEYSIENITSMWMNLFRTLQHEK